MTLNENIVKELNELNSSLASLAGKEVYNVPAGYFEGLAAMVIGRIKALETGTAAEELTHLSPFLGQLSKTMPYNIPAGYFENLQENIEYATTVNDNISSAEELETLSPLLSGLKKDGPFTVPQGYFENLSVGQEPGQAKVISMGMNKPAAKTGSFISRKWFRYAAAAVVTGIIATTAFLFLNQNKIDPTTDSHKWVENKIKKVSTEKLNEFVQLADEEKLDDQSTSIVKVDVKELVKDVPESEIQSLLNDTKLLDDTGNETNTASDDDIMMN